MDLSKTAKKNRDAVEDPLFRTEKLLDELEEIRTRIDAALKVYNETERTLRPALTKLDGQLKQLEDLKAQLALLWKQGYASKWK